MPPKSTPAAPSQNKSTDRNEYIPSFIAKKPFYIDDATASQDDYLLHQRLQHESSKDSLANQTWYSRGVRAGPAATKFRKGACENCGALTHKVKDCLERRRKKGAKWTGKGIAQDEVVEDVKLGWDAKRDRWNGFEAQQYQEVVNDFEALEEVKKLVADGEEEEGAKYEEETDMGRQQSKATRNLRLREDTAKYLLNLDLESAKYDPKTRSMVDAVESTNELIAEEGFQKASGDAGEFERAQTYAWETQERGDKDKVHLQANPTAGEITRKRKAEEELVKKESQKKALLDKYGPQDAIAVNPLKDAQVTESERYVEYDERGKIKGAPAVAEKSMYPEDVFINNHTSVWGSWWRDFKWGYACCHSVIKNSFCTGVEEITAAEEAERFSKGIDLPGAEEAEASIVVPREIALKEEESAERHMPNAVNAPEKSSMDESRRRLEELKGGVNEAEMEKYRREKTAKNDPMANMLGKDELLS
ncbi:mRNA splicing protein [Oleoguttula sp. CCFEE 5521]